MGTATRAVKHTAASVAVTLPDRVERAVSASVDRATGAGCAPRLREAIRYAVFPGGGRLRPSLALATAEACGDARPAFADAAAAAVELIHCASLVHDDLPCFDDAHLRRGKPTVHRVYGEALALLVGDALIVHAFETIARAGLGGLDGRALEAGRWAGEAVVLLGTAAGSTRGIVAGQAWESEPAVAIDEYHRAKTASLFAAAAAMGALSAHADPEPWRRFGEIIGKAYQAADDLGDAVACERSLGKPVGRDAILARPNLVRSVGVGGARARACELIDQAAQILPTCAGEGVLRAWLEPLRAKITQR